MSLAQYFLNKANNGNATEAEILARRKADGREGQPIVRTPKKRGPRVKWTPDRDALLERLAKNHDGRAIAELMGVTYCAIRTRASRIDVKIKSTRGLYHEWTTSEVEKVKIMREKGYTSLEIAKVLNVTDTQVRGTINRMNMPPLRKKWSLEMEYAVACYYRGKDSTIVGEALKMKHSTMAARHVRLAAMRRLHHLRGMTGIRDLVAEYCDKKGIELPRRNKQ